MPTHGMTEDSGARRIDRETLSDSVGQFLSDVRVHAIAMRPWLLGGVDIETGAKSEVVAVSLARNAESSRAGIRDDNGEAELGGNALSSALDNEILFGTGQSRAPIEHWHPVCPRLNR